MRTLAIDFEALFKSMPTPYMMLDRDLRFVVMNDAYLAMVGRTETGLVGKYVFDAFPESEERKEAMKQVFLRALAGQETLVERNPFAIERPGVGMTDVYWNVHHTPVRNIDGEVVAVLQHGQDVSSEVEAERMRDVISQEYDHRVRNLMTRTSAIVRHAARQSTDISSFLADFDHRIAAMARTHDLLVSGGWEHLGLLALVDSELRPFAAQNQAEIAGPDCQLSSRVAQALGMALHELTTNAAKYGALSVPDGTLSVRWRRIDNQGLLLEWRESGSPTVAPNRRPGFGTTIIDRVLPLETGGTVERCFTEAGLACNITLPEPMKH